MEIAIYNESCVMAGNSVSQSTLDQYDGDWHDGADWHVYDGEPEELLSLADKLPASRGRAYDQYCTRVANTLREAVYADRPDLRPVEVVENEDETE